MISREFGRSQIKLSPVTFGSMRLDPEQIELDRAVELITYLYDHGVNTFHSSHEYPTDPFFCEVLREFSIQHPQAEVKHIAKIGVPHFGEEKFSSQRLVTLIENRLRDLNTERIDLVQWLVRHQPNEDLYRLEILESCQDELQITWNKLQQEGKVGALAAFPYSIAFAEKVLQFPTCEGLITYLNLLELEMAPFLDSMAQKGQGYIAIRPLGGGLITNQSAQAGFESESQKLQAIAKTLDISPTQLTQFAIQFPLLHPVVASVMVSISSINHATEIITAVDGLESNPDTFDSILKSIASQSDQ